MLAGYAADPSRGVRFGELVGAFGQERLPDEELSWAELCELGQM